MMLGKGETARLKALQEKKLKSRHREFTIPKR
jgi:hypothetical protein